MIISAHEMRLRQLSKFGNSAIFAISSITLISVAVHLSPHLTNFLCNSDLSIIAWPPNYSAKSVLIDAGWDSTDVCRLASARAMFSGSMFLYLLYRLSHVCKQKEFNFNFEFWWLYVILILLSPFLIEDHIVTGPTKFNISINGSYISNIKASCIIIFIYYNVAIGLIDRLVIYLKQRWVLK